MQVVYLAGILTGVFVIVGVVDACAEYLAAVTRRRKRSFPAVLAGKAKKEMMEGGQGNALYGQGDSWRVAGG